MSTVYLLMGYSGSGKSTWAKNKARDRTAFIVNRDTLREMFYGEYFYLKNMESCVRSVALAACRFILDSGFDVIIDETNLTEERRALWFALAKQHHAKPRVCLVHFTESECNLSYRMRGPRGIPRSKWADVIEEQKMKFEPLRETEIALCAAVVKEK